MREWRWAINEIVWLMKVDRENTLYYVILAEDIARVGMI